MKKLSFKTQFKIEFLLPFTSLEKCLDKSLYWVYSPPLNLAPPQI